MCLNCDRKDYLYMLQTHSQCRLKKLIIYRSQMHQGASLPTDITSTKKGS
jgi:hypothetical protein